MAVIRCQNSLLHSSDRKGRGGILSKEAIEQNNIDRRGSETAERLLQAGTAVSRWIFGKLPAFVDTLA